MYSTFILNFYKRGVLTEDFLKCSASYHEVNHAVLLVGYGKVSPSDRVRGKCNEYWIIRNSWGTKCGEEGFFRLCMDGVGNRNTPHGTCLINKYVFWPTL